MNLSKAATAPQYVDGCFTLYDKVNVADGDYQEIRLKKRDIAPIWYRELSVYDRTQLQFEQAHKEVTIKLSIPQWDGVDSNCVLLINGKQHDVFNATQVISKTGYRETEITCISPEMNYEVEK